MSIKILNKFHTLASWYYYLRLGMQSILQGKPGASNRVSVVRQQFKTNCFVCLCSNRGDFISYIDSLQYHSFGLRTLPFVAIVPNVANLWGDTMSLLNPLNIIQQLILHVNSDTIQLPSYYSNIFLTSLVYCVTQLLILQGFWDLYLSDESHACNLIDEVKSTSNLNYFILSNT